MAGSKGVCLCVGGGGMGIACLFERTLSLMPWRLPPCMISSRHMVSHPCYTTFPGLPLILTPSISPGSRADPYIQVLLDKFS